MTANDKRRLETKRFVTVLAREVALESCRIWGTLHKRSGFAGVGKDSDIKKLECELNRTFQRSKLNVRLHIQELEVERYV